MSDASWQSAGKTVLHRRETGEHQVRTKVAQLDADANIRMAVRGSYWNGAELVLQIQTADKCGRMNIPIKVSDTLLLHRTRKADLHVHFSRPVQVNGINSARPRQCQRSSAHALESEC